MNNKKYIFTFLIIFSLAIFRYMYLVYIDFQDKKEFAVMQTIESDNANLNWKIIRQPMGTSIILLGAKTDDINSPYVWISLNSKGEVKYIPTKVKFYLACSELKKIQELQQIEENVLAFLSSNCQR